MSKSNNKTIANKLSVAAFLNSIENDLKRKEAKEIHKLMKTITLMKAVMWGSSIIGYGEYHYKYESGREGDFMKIGYSPRKASHTIYIMSGFERHKQLMNKLGKYKTGKSCLYIKKLDDIDWTIFKDLIQQSYTYMTNKYG